MIHTDVAGEVSGLFSQWSLHNCRSLNLSFTFHFGGCTIQPNNMQFLQTESNRNNVHLFKKKNLQGFVITPDLQYLKMNVKPWCQLLKNHLETRNTGSDSAAVPQHKWFFCFSSSLWRLIFNQIKLCEKEQQSWALSHLALSKN